MPLLFPFAIGLLFGNLDVFFPSLFGLTLLAALPAAVPADRIVGGVSTAIAGVVKLHPASMGLWFLARSPGSRRARRVLFVTVLGGLGLLGASLAAGGPRPWIDYLAVVRAGSGADLVDPRNGGPAAQIALVAGGAGPAAEAFARALQVPVTLAALAVTLIAAWRIRDAVESLAWAAAASLVILPVTWYHYPSALIPFAVAALLRAGSGPAARRVAGLVAGSAIVAALAIAWLPLLYPAMGLILAATRASRPPGSTQAVD
ncbi:MAG: hypothetical protein NVS9B8_03040 [Candidatus Limnocylindrales bacterium]